MGNALVPGLVEYQWLAVRKLVRECAANFCCGNCPGSVVDNTKNYSEKENPILAQTLIALINYHKATSYNAAIA